MKSPPYSRCGTGKTQEDILLIGDFNSRNKIWDRNANNNSRMGLILEDIINRHGLYITTNTDFT